MRQRNVSRPRPHQLWLAGFIVFVATWFVHAQSNEYEEGKHFFLLPPPEEENAETTDADSQDEIEVLEFFSYSCPACERIEGFIKNWEDRQAKDVVFRREHVIFNASSVPLARAYYLAEELKVLPKIHDKIFEAIHKHRINLAADENLLMQLFKNAAKVDSETFKEKYWARETEDQIREGNRKVATWRISATPTFVVDGKYVVTTESADRNPRTMFQIIEFLTDKIRGESKDGHASGQTKS